MRPPVSSGTVYIKDPVDVWNKEHTIGNAELAARLGSHMTFDRRGTVFAYDDFEDAPLKWVVYSGGGGTGNSATLSSSRYAHSGQGCLKVIPPNVIDAYEYLERGFGGVAKNMLGAEISINRPNDVINRAAISLQIYTGTRLIRAGVSLQQTAGGGISYQTAANAALDASWTTFDDTFTISSIPMSYPIKFVVDVENEKYVRCMFGGTEIDMSSYTPHVANSVQSQMVIATIYDVSKAAANPAMYFDNFILTIEEPA